MKLDTMQDRVVDRSAAHAAPPLLAVRDWLLVALAFSAGSYDAISFLSFGKVFLAFQTGNFVFLGLGVAGTRPPAGPLPVTVVITLAAFALGGALAMPILKSFSGDEEIKDSGVLQAWPRRVSIVLGVALVAQIGFLAVWMTNSLSVAILRILVALAAFAMGLQINAVRFLHVPGVSTTAVTATFMALVSAIATWSLDVHAARRLAGVLMSTAVGAFIGDWMLSHAHTYAPVLPAFVTASVIAIASVALKQESGQLGGAAENRKYRTGERKP